ncbi:MAG TPA: saccharopine dehydrogenase NADP-binding domain-containing protein [Sandaracinaceae bacterium LLY-WYZ-13_1]|nr:saccharopine dehydrogenase NADP-binding domain-containing protein [Sandaracinaceae bacterium LLY-WYZ-13_1]
MASDLPRTRDRSRRFDVVLWGASGFTGRLVAEYLVRHYADTDLRLALAGRNEGKLEDVRRGLAAIDDRAADLPILTGDSFDRASLDAIAADAEVVCTTVGPYAKYGGELVAACVAYGTDYCDLTGETHFIRRMIDAHQDEAEKTGARIVHCCGFDSIPSDLGTLVVQDAFHERHGRYAEEVRFVAGESRGGVSGGTAASMIELLEEAAEDRSVRRILGDPYALNPEGERTGPDGSDQQGVRYDEDLDMWTGPFVMAAINTRIVRRSHALMGYPWGRDFRYSESMSFGGGPKGLLTSVVVTGVLGGVVAGSALPPVRVLLKKRLPKPGEGPSAEQREKGFFRVRLVAKGRDEAGNPATLRGLVEGQNDPGYGETAKMLGESAVCLALDGASLEAGGGIRTPASTMGLRLVERLRDAGMTFDPKP